MQELSREAKREESQDQRIWLSKLSLTDFRNYSSAHLSCGPQPIVLLGSNGSGKTNCLESISLLTAGRGLRGLPFSELARRSGPGSWAVSALVSTGDEKIRIGTGIQPPGEGGTTRSARTVRIDEAFSKGSAALAHIRMLWLTPAMDGLFAGPASERRRFIDRFVLAVNPAYARAASDFDRAMRQRNKALEALAPPRLLDALEDQMANAAVTIAIARQEAFSALAVEICEHRDRTLGSPFPWAEISLAGDLEAQAGIEARSDIQSAYALRLAQGRDRDRLAGRTLIGPHRSDLDVVHGPKVMPAKMCSTGEQKALLVGLVLSQARLIKRLSGYVSPVILLDEVAAHLDLDRRLSLFSSIVDLKAQVWMTGTDGEIFSPLLGAQAAQFFLVSNGSFTPVNDAESLPEH